MVYVALITLPDPNGEPREQVAAICSEEIQAWAVVLANGAERSRVQRYEGEVHVTDVAQPDLEFHFAGRKHP